MKKMLAGMVAGAFLASPAMAQDGMWSGEGSVSAGVNTGNTDTSDVGIGVKMSRETQIWRNSAEFLADYGTKNGDKTKNRFFLSGQADRTMNDNLFGYGRISHEEDEFSGFNSRSFIGGGLGYQVFDNDALIWYLEGGAGLKYDRVRSRRVAGSGGAEPQIIPSYNDESVSLTASSRFSYRVNEGVRLGNNTNLIYADVSTQVVNKSTLTASLTKALSARFSFEVRHDSDPQQGFEKTDTATRMSLVYAFGG